MGNWIEICSYKGFVIKQIKFYKESNFYIFYPDGSVSPIGCISLEVAKKVIDVYMATTVTK